jgi:hypothetical protein
MSHKYYVSEQIRKREIQMNLLVNENLEKDIHIRVSNDLLEHIESISKRYQMNKSTFTRKVLTKFVTEFLENHR